MHDDGRSDPFAAPGTAAGIRADDVVLPFSVDALRGRVVRLGPAVDSILKRHAYPDAVAQALGETTALAAALAATLKYDGVFTLQIKGDGPVRLMVADVTSAGSLRGYAQFDAARVAALPPGAKSVPRLFGAGHLAFTVDQGERTERYQGIVELTGATLAECVHHYFRQSEQFRAGLKAAAAPHPGPDGVPVWRAGAIMIQGLPPEGAAGSAEGRDEASSPDDDAEDAEEAWRRALILMGSATPAELVDPALPAWRLVDRLFLAEGVRIHRPHPLEPGCRCSRARVESVLGALPADDRAGLSEDGRVTVTCEFCNARYVFADEDLARLAGPGAA
jgi:molecular chaperone Hsp33